MLLASNYCVEWGGGRAGGTGRDPGKSGVVTVGRGQGRSVFLEAAGRSAAGGGEGGFCRN
ncbi:hypothetical protein GCM10009560_03350 [Nonomuraea longicatena]|uniref:Uncharacterized protein n=1 Tax=Nonomuraea longicatena TaxID=83682 RepID=A0ABP3Z546_9ACTN